ncbi:MAG: 3-isopropylmalate dehydratase small subunit, partial [Microthrixaceae bacterium]|nr:3-isopropylmalate dehydratase small subunit [Microthrixaceae bacterium]
EVGEQLLRAVEADPELQISIDVTTKTLEVPALDLKVEFPLSDNAQHRLVNGLDDIGITLSHADEIAAYESTRPAWMPTTR